MPGRDRKDEAVVLTAAQIRGVSVRLAEVEQAAEFRYRNPIIEDDTLYVAVSQSGETYDTLAAVQEIQRFVDHRRSCA